MADEVVKLAYDEARAALREQEATLSNLRNRATGLLAAAAVGTSFSATAGLLSADPAKGHPLPAWAAWAQLLTVCLIAVGVMIVVWPTPSWTFGPSAAKLLSRAGEDIDGVLTLATGAMVASTAGNDRILRRRMDAYRGTALALMLELVLLIAGLLAARR